MSTKNGAVLSTEIVPEVLVMKKNYKKWSFRLRTYLKAQDVWDVIESTSIEAVDGKVWQKKNATALHAIHVSCGSDAFSLIEGIPEAKHAWDKLAEPESAPEPEEAILSWNDGTKQYMELYKAVRNGDLNATNQFITENHNAVTAAITCTDRTALHVAAMAGHLSIVKMLVQNMSPQDLLELTDKVGFTAFAAAITCNAKPSIAQCMVRKNEELLTTKADDMLPAALAFRYGHRELGRWLYTITPPHYLLQHRKDSVTIICNAIYEQSFDVAWDLLLKCKELAVTRDKDGVRPVYALANHPSAFQSGCQLKFWQECLYRCIFVDSSLAIKSGKDFPHKVWPKWREKALYLLEILGIKDVYDMKKVHIQNAELVGGMFDIITNLNLDQMGKLCIDAALFQAIERGNVEFVKRIIKANPELVETLDQSNRNILMLAVKVRHPKIFSLIYNSNSELSATSTLDIQGNTMLHLAAYLAPPDVLNRIPGAALQLQSELQWFEKVRSIVPPWTLNHKNNQDMTPVEILNEKNRELVAQGEKWMKDTAQSYTVVGALIITIMFAAAFTVPGGNNQDSGFPIFVNKKLFMIFIISDSLSLFSSATSVLMFLGILTSRYLQEDFLVSLPRKLMIGLFTLFFSIVSMMVAFSATLLIVFGQKYPWISIPVTCLASIPVTLFVFLQFPLLADIFSSTFGRGMFDKKVRI